MRANFAIVVASVLLSPAACGSRSELPGSPFDAGGALLDAAGEMTPAVQTGSPCNTDADCATDRYCVASARCDGVVGCVLSERSCDDGVGCTHDTCSDVARSCTHSPDDTLCPATMLCSSRRGCDAFVFSAASDGHIYETRIPSGELVDLGEPAALVTDLALGSNGVLYATDSYILYRVDRATAVATTIASILPLHQYAGLGQAADGSLWATADAPQLFQIDAASGSSLAVAALASSVTGDVTALGARVLVTVSNVNPPTDTLVAVDPSTQRSSIVGDLHFQNVWGLAALGGVVYGLTRTGAILTVDAATGNATLLAQVAGVAFLGAAGR
jgi:hypothetical protein